jgi:hypothetical protein
MARKRTIRLAAPAPARSRVTVPMDETLRRRAVAFATMHGLKLGDVVEAALEVHLRGCYFVERAGSGPGPAPLPCPAGTEAEPMAESA